jgi:hypothetical protein
MRDLTAPAVNRRIDAQTERNLCKLARAGPEEVGRRMRELDREWDLERILEFDSGATGLIGLGLGVYRNPAWLLVPGAVAGMMLVHALAGPYPMLPILRRIGFRTRGEIEREKDALEPPAGAGARATEGKWDPDRVLQTGAGIGVAAGLALGAVADRRWFALPAAVFSFLLACSIQGWRPPAVRSSPSTAC